MNTVNEVRNLGLSPLRFRLWRCAMIGMVIAVALFTSSWAMAQDGEDVGELPTTPEALSKRIDELTAIIARRPDRIWISAFQIRELSGADQLNAEALAPSLSKKLEDENAHVRLAAAQVLLSLAVGDLETTIDALTALVAESEASDVVAAAARLIAKNRPEAEKVGEVIDAMAGRFSDGSKLSAEARVNLAEALCSLDRDELHVERLRQFAASGSSELRDRAALALFRRGEGAEVVGRLKAVAAKSGDLALNARLALEIERDQRSIAEVETMGRPAVRRDLVRTVISTVVKSYASDSYSYGLERLSVDAPNLVDAAARGMAGSVDNYGEYLTAKEYNQANEVMAGSYGGIGAHVTKLDFDPAVRISQPIYSGPAYKAGLRSGDYLWKVEVGDKTTDVVGKDVDEVRSLLVGQVGTKIRLWVKRLGHEELLPIDLTREEVNVNTAQYTMLPSGIGYIRLSRFGADSHNDMQRALAALTAQGAEGLILDLRGNGGGYLHVTLHIAACFLQGEVPVVMVRGMVDEYKRNPVYPASAPFDRQARRLMDWPRFTKPMVVLIDGSSASGSELLSGSLKDHGRATVVGQKSFGKGTGQSTYPLRERDLRIEALRSNGRMLKVTVFNYYIMPSMTSVERINGVGGVVPHLEVLGPSPTSWEAYQMVDLDRSNAITEWVRVNWAERGAELRKAADFDGLKWEAYPGFDELYESLQTTLSRDRVRQELKREIRVRAADDRGEAFIESYLEDYALQRGIIALSKKMAVEADKVAEFTPFIGAHKD